MKTTVLMVLATACALGQGTQTGRTIFERSCAKCHGADARGGEMGPNILGRIAARDDNELMTLFRNGTGNMPPVHIATQETPVLIRFLRSIERRPREMPLERMKAQLVDG